MAGDWMKIDLELPDKPEVHAIAGTLNLDPDAVVGKLIRVWQWFDKHTENGNAYGVTYSLLDRITGVTGFGEAMSFVGWIEQKDKTLVMQKFDKHTSKSAKTRANTANRVKRLRTENVTPEALPREEKRRVNNKADVELPSCISKEVWDRWIAYRKERRIACATGTLEGQIKKLVAFSKAGHDANAILEESISNGWQGIFEPKTTPKAATVHQLPDFMRGAI